MKTTQPQNPRPSKPLRLHVLSDLHLEFGPLSIPKPDAYVVVLAGDVHVGAKGLEWIKQHFAGQPVVYVLGNHEFYHNGLPSLTQVLMPEKCEGLKVRTLRQIYQASAWGKIESTGCDSE